MADEYIRKQDAVDELRFEPIFSDAWNALREARDRIKAMPFADVIEITHGAWMSVPEMWGMFNARYYCSKCGNDAIINNRERYVLSDYCPHCGAIMGNKKGNENG